jgi:hypothetical protein
MPTCNGTDRGCNITLPRKRADFLLVSAGVDRQPTGVGCDADTMARSQRPVAGATAATESHLGSRLCRSNAQVVPNANGATACLPKVRCPMLELHASEWCPCSS